ncbi:hypothetical protein RHSIM_Rhsim07G0108000 [Rhododendron simsii]|uniref:CBF1-interacting co-repressor CIR N-terminal domain-containing protein n=1 Tax=Rhododendron simsii TaxID=118357 RepID=A0A834GKL1_RHOSS|nr:hypothetical protein RHSIM_Rhsim07G0108000 [Rhododendron simsii]
MGGHGGLNILPQKRWNVYNFDNREKVRKDEEAAAKEEQLKREQSRKRDTEFRIEQLRQARGLAPLVHQPSTAAPTAAAPAPPSPEPESKSKLNHINLFEGIRIFDPVEGKKEDEDRGGARKKMKVEKKKEEVRVVLPEDEKYKLGYGVAGKGVKLPWLPADVQLDGLYAPCMRGTSEGRTNRLHPSVLYGKHCKAPHVHLLLIRLCAALD